MTDTVGSNETGSSALGTPEEQAPPTLAVEEPGGYLYHYTSAAGLVGIVDGRRDADVSRRLTFFASDLLQMNDITELAFGLKIVREHADRVAAGRNEPDSFQQWLPTFEKYLSTPTLESLRAAPRPCVCATSFTTKDDLLSQWVTYGAGGGFAIGLDAQTLRDATYTGHNVRTGKERSFKCLLTRVHYGEKARAQVAQLPLFDPTGAQIFTLVAGLQSLLSFGRAVWDSLKDPQRRPPSDVVEHVVAAVAITVAAQYKNEAFEAEDEWRLLAGGGSATALTDLLSGHYPPNFRSAASRVLPYRPITVTAPDGQPIIRDLVVGPARDQVQLVHAAQQLLIANGHDSTIVRASGIPYRGW